MERHAIERGEIPQTWYHRLRYVLGLIALVPATKFAATGYLIEALLRPTPYTFRKWGRIWSSIMLRVLNIRFDVQYAQPLVPERPAVYVANHQSGLDIWMLFCALPVPFGFAAKASLARVPFLGWALAKSPSVFIERNDPRKSLMSLRTAGERVRTGAHVAIFPEGSRSYAAALRPFKKGAFLLALEAGVPIIPIGIVNAYSCMNEGLGLVRPGTTHIHVGAPIDTSHYTRKTVRSLVELTEQRVRELMACPPDQASDVGETTPNGLRL